MTVFRRSQRKSLASTRSASASYWHNPVPTQSSLACLPDVFTVADSLDVFEAAGRVIPTDPRILARLAEVQQLVGDDLEWVETAILAICDQGVEPASNAARHLVARGGKRVRPLTTLLAAGCFGPIPPAARTLALVSELVHSATLLHDDVADEGTERRGVRAARIQYGNAVSVLAGDMLLVHALQRTAAEAPDALPELLTTLRSLVDGEIVQLRGRAELDVRETTYDRVLRGKTASLFAWAARAGARVAHASSEDVCRLGEFGEQLGVAFQLVDDVLDYDGVASGKTSLTDLREGKLTLPLVLAVSSQPELLHTVKRIHAGDLEPVEMLGRKVVASGACSIVRKRALAVTERALESLRPIRPSPAKDLLTNVALELSARIG